MKVAKEYMDILTKEFIKEFSRLDIDSLKQLVWDLSSYLNRDDQAFAYEGSFSSKAFIEYIRFCSDSQIVGLIIVVGTILRDNIDNA